MKTVEFLKELEDEFYLGDPNSEISKLCNTYTDLVLYALKEHGIIQYNQAIEDAPENAVIEKIEVQPLYDPRPYYRYDVNKQSILDLKK